MTPLRVLLVEDSEDDRLLIERQLRQGGYDVSLQRVDTPEAMAAALVQGPWDVIIADYTLPSFGAIAALRHMQGQQLDIPFLVVSGSIGEDTAVAAMKAGAHDYIMKDSLARLVPAIEREMREAAGRRERRRAEAQLRASELRYHSLFETARDAIAVWDDDGRLVDGNAAYCALAGQERDALLGSHTPRDVEPPEATVRFSVVLDELKRSGEFSGELPLLRKDGARRTVEVTGIRAAPGLCMTILRDVTERRGLEQQLQQAQRMESIGTLAGGIAHDFNNTLTGISGYADLALMQLSPVHPLYADLQQIRKQAEHAATLTRQLLAFSRRQMLERKPVNLNQVIGELEGFLRRVIGEHIDLRILKAPDLATAYVDPVQVEQVLMNLCINARDAMPEGGRLVVETSHLTLDAAYARTHAWAKPGPYVLISVTDTGVGMDRATIERIFDPFFTTKEPGKGTGLGLAMVYGIVKQHEGLIHVYSEPGRGSTFKVYFPAIEAAAEQLVRPGVEPPRGGSETVLVAEDDEMVRELVVRTLEAHGYRVVTAVDGEDALRAFETVSDEVAVAIVDAVMPKLGGRDVYRALRARRADLKFVFVSGYSVNALDERFLQDEALQFVQKPFGPAELARRVREVLDR